MPSAAERTRTLVQSTCSSVLLCPGLEQAPSHALTPESRTIGRDGEVLLVLPGDSPAVRAAARAQDGGLDAVLEVTDVAPVAVPHRVRGRAWVSGRLTRGSGGTAPGSAMLRLRAGALSVDDLWGAEAVAPEDFRAARADPLSGYEAELLQHLAAAHDGELQSLRALLGDRTGARSASGAVAVPLALDRLGLRIRFVGVRTFDARFDFPEPVADIGHLRRALHTLFHAAAG